MRYAIIADIHANQVAFTAVLDDIKRRGGVEKVWCLGDVVGYGPDPHECLELLQQTNHICVPGNHDWAAINKIDTSDFNPDAAAANHWTAKQLSPADIGYLGNLPLVIKEENFTLVHGSPREPIWEYILYPSTAGDNFNYFKTPLCLVGHTHIPVVFRYAENRTVASSFSTDAIIIQNKDRLIINPGSVGQPRDNNPRASYAIYDDSVKTIRLYRVDYDIRSTQEKMAKVRLPEFLITRLSYGI